MRQLLKYGGGLAMSNASLPHQSLAEEEQLLHTTHSPSPQAIIGYSSEDERHRSPPLL